MQAIANAQRSHGGLLRAVSAAVSRLADPIVQHVQRQRAYESLMALDDRLLKDIGITRADIPSIVRGHGPNELVRTRWTAAQRHTALYT